MRPFLLFTLAASLILGHSAHAATFTVTNLNDSGSGSLRGAITSANSQAGADTITFAAGLSGTIALDNDLPTITSDMTISAPGGASVNVDGQNSQQIFHITSGTVSISGLTFTRGNTNSYGGAIYNRGTSLTLRDCTFTSNSSGSYGGALVNFDSSLLVVTRCTFIGNHSGAYGGAIVNFIRRPLATAPFRVITRTMAVPFSTVAAP